METLTRCSYCEYSMVGYLYDTKLTKMYICFDCRSRFAIAKKPSNATPLTRKESKIVRDFQLDNTQSVGSLTSRKAIAKYAAIIVNPPVSPTEQKAYDMRQEGKTYREISQVIGISKATARRWVRKVYKHTKEQTYSLTPP